MGVAKIRAYLKTKLHPMGLVSHIKLAQKRLTMTNTLAYSLNEES